MAVGTRGHERGAIEPDPDVHRRRDEAGQATGYPRGGGPGPDQLARLHEEQLRDPAGARRYHAGAVWTAAVGL